MEDYDFTDQPSARNDEHDLEFDTDVPVTEGHLFEHPFDPNLNSSPIPSEQPNPMPREQPLAAIIADSLEFRRYRITLIESIPDISLETKIKLRDALGDDWWPWWLRSYENFTVDPMPSGWPVEDHHALLLIRRVHPIPIETIAATFFPKRSVDEVQRQWDEFMGMDLDWNTNDDELLVRLVEQDGMTFPEIAKIMKGYEWWQLELIYTQLVERRRKAGEE